MRSSPLGTTLGTRASCPLGTRHPAPWERGHPALGKAVPALTHKNRGSPWERGHPALGKRGDALAPPYCIRGRSTN